MYTFGHGVASRTSQGRDFGLVLASHAPTSNNDKRTAGLLVATCRC